MLEIHKYYENINTISMHIHIITLFSYKKDNSNKVLITKSHSILFKKIKYYFQFAVLCHLKTDLK